MNTYGKEIIETVKQIDKAAIIWDSNKQGRPDLVEMAYHYYVEFGAEVQFCIYHLNHHVDSILGRVHHQQPKDDSQHCLRHGEQRCSRLRSSLGLVNILFRTFRCHTLRSVQLSVQSRLLCHHSRALRERRSQLYMGRSHCRDNCQWQTSTLQPRSFAFIDEHRTTVAFERM